jgi:hypothetical protein
MVEQYVVRDDEVDLMHDVRPESHFDLTIDLAERIVKIAEQQNRELQNLIDYIISRSHSIDEIIDYATNLKQRLGEK